MEPNYCISCCEELFVIDNDPNGTPNAECKRCVAEQEHDFDAEPDAEFDRFGNRIGE